MSATESFPIDGYWLWVSGNSSSNYLLCVATYYTAQGGEFVSNTSTVHTTVTQSSVTSFTTTTDVSETAGYVTATTIYATRTDTGALHSTVQVCTFTSK